MIDRGGAAGRLPGGRPVSGEISTVPIVPESASRGNRGPAGQNRPVRRQKGDATAKAGTVPGKARHEKFAADFLAKLPREDLHPGHESTILNTGHFDKYALFGYRYPAGKGADHETESRL